MIPQRVTFGGLAAAGLAALAPVSAMAQAPAEPAPRWRLGLSASGTWNENALFVGGDEATAWSTSGRASLTHERTLRRGSFSIGGYGGMIYYPEIDDFNQSTYGGSLGLDWAPSPRTQLSLGQTYDRSNTRELRSLDPEGLPLPTSALNNAASSVNLSQGLSRRWQLGLGAAFTVRRYDDPALVGGEQLNASLELSRQLGKTTAAYLSYGYGSSWFEDDQRRTHQALVGGRKQQEHVSWDVGGGAAYVESVGSWYPAGHAGMSATGRRTSLSLRYSRDFGQAFGYGRETIADVISATLAWTPHRRLSFDAGYSIGYRRDPAEDGYEIRSLVASAGFGWTIAKDLGFSGHYYWERNETEGFDVVQGSRATASLSYGASWR